jgi:hypothetical protein
MLAFRYPCGSRPIAAGCETTANMPQPAASSRAEHEHVGAL